MLHTTATSAIVNVRTCAHIILHININYILIYALCKLSILTHLWIVCGEEYSHLAIHEVTDDLIIKISIICIYYFMCGKQIALTLTV